MARAAHDTAANVHLVYTRRTGRPRSVVADRLVSRRRRSQRRVAAMRRHSMLTRYYTRRPPVCSPRAFRSLVVSEPFRGAPRHPGKLLPVEPPASHELADRPLRRQMACAPPAWPPSRVCIGSSCRVDRSIRPFYLSLSLSPASRVKRPRPFRVKPCAAVSDRAAALVMSVRDDGHRLPANPTAAPASRQAGGRQRRAVLRVQLPETDRGRPAAPSAL